MKNNKTTKRLMLARNLKTVKENIFFDGILFVVSAEYDNEFSFTIREILYKKAKKQKRFFRKDKIKKYINLHNYIYSGKNTKRRVVNNFYLKLKIVSAAINYILTENVFHDYKARRYKLNVIEDGSGEILIFLDNIFIGDCSNFIKIKKTEIPLLNAIKEVADEFTTKLEEITNNYDKDYLQPAKTKFKNESYIEYYE